MSEVKHLIDQAYFIGEIDGYKCQSLQSFLTEISIAFRFPSYYGNNINAFWDCIGDLSWIKEKNYALIIKNSSIFLKNEDEKTRNDVFVLLKRVTNDWAGVPNFEGEEEYRQKSDFKILFQ